MNFFKKASLGLDVGTRSIKIVGLSQKNGRVVLEKCFIQDLYFENVEGVKISSTQNTLNALVETHQLKGKGVSTHLSDSLVHQIHLQFPELPEKELHAAVLNEVELKYNIQAANSCIDFVSHPLLINGKKRIDVSVFVAPLVQVTQSLDIVKAAHLKPVAVENNMSAIGACLKFNEYFSSGLAHCLVVDIGQKYTSLGLFRGSQLVSVQLAMQGADTLFAPIRLPHQVQGWKVQELFSEREWSDDTEELLRPSLEAWSDAVSDKFFHLKEQFAGIKIEKGFLTGAGSRGLAFQKWLSQMTDLPFGAVDPFRKIEVLDPHIISDKHVVDASAYMSTVVGLALRDVEP